MGFRSFTFWLTFLAGTSTEAQPEAIRTRTDTGWTTTHFYLSGEVSATEWSSSSAAKRGFTCFKKDGSIQWQKEWTGTREEVKFKARYRANGAVCTIELYEPRPASEPSIVHRWAWSPSAPDVIAWTDTIIPADVAVPALPPGAEVDLQITGEQALGPTPAMLPPVPSFYITEVFVIKGNRNVNSVLVEAFEQDGTLRRTAHEFAWLDTLGIGTLYDNAALPEVIDLGIVTATTNEREIKKRRAVPVVIGATVDLAPFHRRY